MLQAVIIGGSLATSAFVLGFSVWRRPRPWLESAVTACLAATGFWLTNFALFVIFFKRTQVEWASHWFGCSFLLSLTCPVTAYGLGWLSALFPKLEKEELGLSPTESD